MRDRKKERRLQRQRDFVGRLKADVGKKKEEMAKKRKAFSTMQDMKQVLPDVDSDTPKQPRQSKPIGLKPVSQSARRKSNLSEIKRLQTVQRDESFQADPFAALQMHLQMSFSG
ncbi:MAG: hypothetical protein SGCHY_000588 [Lobulomycetales sp.]